MAVGWADSGTISPQLIGKPGWRDRLSLVAMRAVGAAAAGGAGAGAAASLVGVVETTALKFNAAGREQNRTAPAQQP